MAIQFQCAGCGQPIEVDDEAANQQASCPYCDQIVRVPDAGAADSPVPPPPFGHAAPPLTALPAPTRQVTGMTPATSAQGPRAPLGFIALALFVLAVGAYVWGAVETHRYQTQQLGADPTQIDMDQMMELARQMMQDKPWAIAAPFVSMCLGLLSVVLCIGSIARRERPVWPAAVVITGCVGAFCLVSFSLVGIFLS